VEHRDLRKRLVQSEAVVEGGACGPWAMSKGENFGVRENEGIVQRVEEGNKRKRRGRTAWTGKRLGSEKKGIGKKVEEAGGNIEGRMRSNQKGRGRKRER